MTRIIFVYLLARHARVDSYVNVTQVINLEKQQVGNLRYVFIPGHAGHLLVRRGACCFLLKQPLPHNRSPLTPICYLFNCCPA
jgi:hypothetical protein